MRQAKRSGASQWRSITGGAKGISSPVPPQRRYSLFSSLYSASHFEQQKSSSLSLAKNAFMQFLQSFRLEQEQQDLLETMESEDCTPSLSQAVQLKKLSQSGELTMDKIFEILREPKANQQEKISFRLDDLRKFFPKSYTPARIQERILKLLEADCRKRQLSRGER